MPKFNNVELTEQTMQRTRQHFVANSQACIDEAKNGSVRVNDIETYIQWRRNQIEEVLAGNDDHTFTFLQRAYYLQTGEMVALFS